MIGNAIAFGATNTEGYLERSRFGTGDERRLPQSGVRSQSQSPKYSDLRGQTQPLACAKCPRLPLRLVTFVVEPNGQAMAICRSCWRETIARETQEFARRKFFALFLQRRQPIIQAGGAVPTTWQLARRVVKGGRYV